MNFYLLDIFVFVLILIVFANSQGVQDCSNNGVLVGEKCQCNSGFAGSRCQDCTGRIILNETSGYFYSGSAVSRFVNCMVMIQPPKSENTTLHVRFDYFASSCQCDFLIVYDGTSVFDPILATFNGEVLPSQPSNLISNSGSVLLQFHNDDRVFHTEGYSMIYWLEEDSSVVNNNASESCEEVWCNYNWMTTLGQGRASAGSVILDDTLYVFGGELFAYQEVWESFMKLNLTSKMWEVASTDQDFINSTLVPEIRYDHTLVAWEDKLIMFGGAFANNTITNELWEFDVTEETWTVVSNNATSGHEPPSLIGHSAHVTSYNNGTEIMLVFFGYHPVWRINPNIFQLDLESQQWDVINATGALPIPTYGHASAMDVNSNIIYIHGGFNDNIFSHLHMYEVETMTWTILRASLDARYLHTMAFLSGSLYVFGGKLDLPNFDVCTKCPDPKTLAYNIECLEWNEVTENLLIASDRYGHTVAEVNNTMMLLFGGYDGGMKSDVITYTVEDFSFCANLNESECNATLCSWNGTECRYEHICSEGRVGICEGICGSLTTCLDCTSSICSCCYDYTNAQCLASSGSSCPEMSESSCGNGTAEEVYCSRFESCQGCSESGCQWYGNSRCGIKQENTSSSCPSESCPSLSTCESCTRNKQCFWCQTSQSCTPISDSPIMFPYDNCLQYISNSDYCAVDSCVAATSCDHCFEDHKCGWCDLGSDTGFGSCMSGGIHGSLNMSCPKDQWHFAECPACQCNGHSTCDTEPSVCSHCDVGTTGPTCGECDDMYYGDAANGGTCTECECNNHATKCSLVGNCDCDVKGIIGRNCQICQMSSGFFGEPINGSCYYTMEVMTRYFYPLGVDEYIKGINFDACPSESQNHEVEMTISGMTVNITATINTTSSAEKVYQSFTNVSYAKVTFLQSDVNFHDGHVCLRIYVEWEASPDRIELAFTKSSTSIGILIAVFLLCFLSLLLLTGLIWKANSVFSRMRRRRMVQTEMRRLQARPVGAINLEVEDSFSCDVDPLKTLGKYDKRTDEFEDTIISEEICSSKTASVFTALLWLPSRNQRNQNALVLGTFLGSRPMYAEESNPVVPDTKETDSFNRVMHSISPRRLMRRSRVADAGIDNPNFQEDA